MADLSFSMSGGFKSDLVDADPAYLNLLQVIDSIEASDQIPEGGAAGERESWLHIIELGDDLLSRHRDARILIARIRAELNSGHLDKACEDLGRLTDWIHSDGKNLSPGLEDGALVAALSYFGHATFVEDLRRVHRGDTDPVEVLTAAQAQAQVRGGGKTSIFGQPSFSRVAADDMLAALRQIFDFCAANNPLGLRIDGGPVTELLSTAAAQAASWPEAVQVIASDTGVRAPMRYPATALASREDVASAIDAICDWFGVHEPAHPAPIFLRRARRLIGADFASILADVVPDADAALQRLNGPVASLA